MGYERRISDSQDSMWMRMERASGERLVAVTFRASWADA